MLYLTCFRTLHAFFHRITFFVPSGNRIVTEALGVYYWTTCQQACLRLYLYHLCGGLYIYFFHIAMSSFLFYDLLTVNYHDAFIAVRYALTAEVVSISTAGSLSVVSSNHLHGSCLVTEIQTE